MAQKIRSLELSNGVVVNFLTGGKIQLTDNITGAVLIHDSDLKIIRDTASRNGRIEAGNGIETVNKEKEKV